MTKINTNTPILIDLPMPIETDRLIIREPRFGDGEALHKAKIETWNTLHEWMPWAKEPSTIQDDEIVMREAHIKFLQRTDLMMVAFEKATGNFVGGTGLHRFDWETRFVEIGYWCKQSLQGKGYATEITKALIRFAVDALDAPKVIICHADGNEGSKRVIQKCGFDFEYTIKNQGVLPDGKIVDEHFYSVANADHLRGFNVQWGRQLTS